MASARGEMVGARGELLGARGGCAPDLHCSQGVAVAIGGLWRQGPATSRTEPKT